jgi:hypothetical protein
VEKHGGFGLQRRPVKEYADRLGLGTKRPPKNSTTHSKRNTGAYIS